MGELVDAGLIASTRNLRVFSGGTGEERARIRKNRSRDTLAKHPALMKNIWGSNPEARCFLRAEAPVVLTGVRTSRM